MVALSRNVSRKHAMEMLLTGEMVAAKRAAEIGLINRVVPAGDELKSALALAQADRGEIVLHAQGRQAAFYPRPRWDWRRLTLTPPR